VLSDLPWCATQLAPLLQTDLVDLPYHTAVGLRAGEAATISISDAILNWFRDSVAAKRGKIVVWRTWDVHPDESHSNPAAYLNLTKNIAPHPRLFFSMKHQGWDYWRCVLHHIFWR
jgi:hypothetical protein